MKTLWCVALTALLSLPAIGQIDLNRATADELQELPGIGETLAERIVRDRQENGPYASVDDLARVPGVSSAVIAKIGSRAQAGSGAVSSGAPRGGVSAARVAEVLRRFAGEPSVREVQAAALAYVRVNPVIIDSWRVRARSNAMLPQFRARFDYDVDDDQSVRIVNAPEPGQAPSQTETKDDDKAYELQLQATWDLDRLLFEPMELATNREAIRLANLRDRVLDEVTRRYFERRRLQVDMELSPPRDVADAVRKELRIQELTADIDSLTGGWFGDTLKKSGRDPY